MSKEKAIYDCLKNIQAIHNRIAREKNNKNSVYSETICTMWLVEVEEARNCKNNPYIKELIRLNHLLNSKDKIVRLKNLLEILSKFEVEDKVKFVVESGWSEYINKYYPNIEFLTPRNLLIMVKHKSLSRKVSFSIFGLLKYEYEF